MSDDVTAGAMPTADEFTDRVRKLIEDAREHVETLTARKVALVNEREAEVRRIRDDYKTRIDAIDAELAVVHRLERAVEGQGPGRPKAATNGNHNGNGNGSPAKLPFRPSQEVLDRVLVGLSVAEKSAISPLADELRLSHTTVKAAVEVMREDRLTRLAGQGARNAKLYALTPDGKDRAARIKGGK
jgi:hypothetical protein